MPTLTVQAALLTKAHPVCCQGLLQAQTRKHKDDSSLSMYRTSFLASSASLSILNPENHPETQSVNPIDSRYLTSDSC